ncbi:TetR/AcrR family transcriptional regulator [Lacicoccus alkaliphilus]|uniref:Transcriptional regulator, TetR family n=1 Tax=Lacicoccus alkaliphilus DSM 16010 TaxID=1123231 RepID=A0A1M7JJR3_9BACL|nr:TetR/AcrR family transcriptional regulator [Salinicoccus alkaliphilus]SHM53238.1 transcriptional regulator, TetR family [Salinicoccus alkaliphilus DSM 16010]
MDKEELYLDCRVIRTKRALNKSLLHFLKHERFSDINVSDISKHAGVTRSSFYNHYSSKGELLNSLMSMKHRELVYAYRKPLLRQHPFSFSRLPPSELHIFNHISHNADYYSTILKSDLSSMVETWMIESFKTINLEEVNVKDDNIQSDLLASYLAYAVVGLIKQWVEEDYKYDAEFMNEQLLALMKIPPHKTFHIKLHR